MERIWLRNPLAVFTANDLDAAGGVVVEGTTITSAVPAGASPTQPFDLSFDAGRHVVLPGLVNTHHHFYQTLTRATPAALDRELFPWLTALYPIWAQLTPDLFDCAATVALAELLCRVARQPPIITTCFPPDWNRRSTSRSPPQDVSVRASS